MKLYIERRQHFVTLTKAFNYSAKPRQWVLDELSKALKKVRYYRSYHRNGCFEEQRSWDCGRQDAFGDQVDQAYCDFAALKIAYKLQLNEATTASKLFNAMVGFE